MNKEKKRPKKVAQSVQFSDSLETRTAKVTNRCFWWHLLKSAPDQRTYSTEIPHARVATSRFNAYQALQLYTKSVQNAIPLLYFFTHHFAEISRNFLQLYGKLAQKQAFFHISTAGFPPFAGFFSPATHHFFKKSALFFVIF